MYRSVISSVYAHPRKFTWAYTKAYKQESSNSSNHAYVLAKEENEVNIGKWGEKEFFDGELRRKILEDELRGDWYLNVSRLLLRKRWHC